MSQQVKIYRKLTLETGGDGSAARILSGDSTTSASYTVGSPIIEIYATSSSTSASTSAQPLYIKSTMTGTAGVGGRSQFHMYTNVSLGGWANALKGYTEFGTAGKVTGLASSVLAEMKTANASLGTGGAYFPLEVEYVAGGTSTTSQKSLSGNHVGFIWLEQSGDADGDFDDKGYFMHMKGMTGGTGHVFHTGANTGTIAGSLRIGVNTTEYFIPLWSNEVQA